MPTCVADEGLRVMPGRETAEAQEHGALRDGLRRMLTRQAPEQAVRAQFASAIGHDEHLWHRLAVELGVQGLGIPPEFGGAGCGWREVAIAAEEIGHGLIPGPMLSTVYLSATLLQQSDDARATQAYLPGIAQGSTIATVALPRHGAGWDCGLTNVRATVESHSSALLTGTVPHVLDGHIADVVFVPAIDGAHVSLYAVDLPHESVSSRRLTSMDQSRRYAELTFSGSPARLVGQAGAAQSLLDRTVPLAVIGLAAEQLGGSRKMLDVTVEYAKTRVQFGRAIGSFQAIKHKLADLFIAVELAGAALDDAIEHAERADPGLAVASSAAKILCSESSYDVAAAAIQVHGGIGFTWEHMAHLYFKRAAGDRMLLGRPSVHQQLLARALDLEA